MTCGALLLSGLAATPANAAAFSPDQIEADEASATGLPIGLERGALSTVTAGGIEVFEVLDASGSAVGFTLSAETLASLVEVSTLVEAELGDVDAEPSPTLATARAAVNVPLCVAAIAWFVAQTVFPAARVATLVARLGGLVAKYGVTTVARIFTGARGIASRTAEQEIRDFALAASGVGGLAACGIDL